MTSAGTVGVAALGRAVDVRGRADVCDVAVPAAVDGGVLVAEAVGTTETLLRAELVVGVDRGVELVLAMVAAGYVVGSAAGFECDEQAVTPATTRQLMIAGAYLCSRGPMG